MPAAARAEWGEPGPPARASVRAPEADPVKLPFLWWLWFYRNAISPLDGPRCGMWPTCSAYATQAVRAHGPLFGGFLAADRLLHEGSARPPEYEIVERYGRRWVHDPVEANDRLFRRGERARPREEPALPARRTGEPLSLAALADPALAREAARRFLDEDRPWDAVTELRRAAFLAEELGGEPAAASSDLAEAGWIALGAGARLDAPDAFLDADLLFDAARTQAVRARGR